jgi:LmbE family N-acetylglucosaminyl deacetylase
MLDIEPTTTLVIAPHPDDEVFGCGGFIHRLKNRGKRVYVLFMTVGSTRDFSAKGQSAASDRVRDLEKAAEFMKLDGYAIALPGDEYHLQLDTAPQKVLIHAIERGEDISLEELRPDLVLAPSDADYNQDHRAVSRATMTAVRPASRRYKSYQPVVMSYELPYHQWNLADAPAGPDFYVRLSQEDMEAKIGALQMYESQLKAPDSPLSVHGVRTLAAYRGLQCAEEYAEAYKIQRMVI